MFTETINRSAQLALPETNTKVWAKGWTGSIATDQNRDGGFGFFHLDSGQARVLNLRDLHTAAINDNGMCTIQTSGAVTVKVTTAPYESVDIEIKRLAAGGAGVASNAQWVTLAVAANAIIDIPDNVSGIYVLGGASVSVNVRRT